MESQTGDIQAMSPTLTRLLAVRANEEREAAERGPGESGHSLIDIIISESRVSNLHISFLVDTFFFQYRSLLFMPTCLVC